MSAALKGLTSTGEPRMNATFHIRLEDGSIEAAKVVGKGRAKGGVRAPVITVLLEWGDGVRQWADWPELLDVIEFGTPETP